MNKAEILLIIGSIKSLIAIVEAFKPDLAHNKVVIELQNAITALETLGV